MGGGGGKGGKCTKSSLLQATNTSRLNGIDSLLIVALSLLCLSVSSCSAWVPILFFLPSNPLPRTGPCFRQVTHRQLVSPLGPRNPPQLSLLGMLELRKCTASKTFGQFIAHAQCWAATGSHIKTHVCTVCKVYKALIITNNGGIKRSNTNTEGK